MLFLLGSWELKQTIRSLLNHTCKNREVLVRAAMQFTSHQVKPFNQREGWWPETTRRGQQLRDRYSSVPRYKMKTVPAVSERAALNSFDYLLCSMLLDAEGFEWSC